MGSLITLRQQHRVNSLFMWTMTQGSGRMPMLHKGPEPEQSNGPEETILDRVVFDQLLSLLSEKERVTIEMWSQGWTLHEIARYISFEYEDRSEGNLLSPRTLGARVTKILQKLRFYFVRERNHLKWSEKG